jgi:hypothetical protein
VPNLDANRALDVYGRYVWTRQACDSARLSGFDERLKFDAVGTPAACSRRRRVHVGARYSAAWNETNRFYAGAA